MNSKGFCYKGKRILKCGRQNFFWEGMIWQVLFNSKNKPNIERIVFLWYFIYLVNITP